MIGQIYLFQELQPFEIATFTKILPKKKVCEKISAIFRQINYLAILLVKRFAKK